MEDERKQVLEMLADGKITSQEAHRLIKALGEGTDLISGPGGEGNPPSCREGSATGGPRGRETGRSRGKQASSWRLLGDEIRKLLREALREAKLVTREVSGEVRDGVYEAMRESRGALQAAFFEGREAVQEALSESRHAMETAAREARGAREQRLAKGPKEFVVEESHEVEFSDLAEPVTVSVGIQNGSISLHTHDGAQAQVNLVKRIRGQFEGDDAASRAEGIVTVLFGGNDLNIEGAKQFGGRHAVEVDIGLPARGQYNLNLDILNGGISIRDLTAERAIAGTTNGEISIIDIVAEEIKAVSANSRITARLRSPNIQFNTTNGEINLRLPDEAAGEVRLKSVNGNIGISVARHKGLSVKAETQMGSIRLQGLDEVAVEDEEKGEYGYHRLAAVSPDYQRDTGLRIDATTVHGVINGRGR